nr:guanylate kinase [Roseimaritima sediminicola]
MNWPKTLSKPEQVRQTALGRLIVISGPSGAGKSTVVRRLLQKCPLPLELSVSATTRHPRPGEVDGREYQFLTPERFAQLRSEGAFLECKEVFGLGRWYGTLRQPVASGLKAGNWVILEIDVEGALEVMRCDLDPITLFIHPGDRQELERRLRTRKTETDAQIAARLATADAEYEALPYYQHLVINDQVERAVDEICTILKQYQDG